MRKLFVLVILLSTVEQGLAQKGDTTTRKNTIKMDVTSHWLYRNAAMFTYERVTQKNPYHTWSVTAGYQQFPSLSGTFLDSVSIQRESKAAGFKVGGEYRFYLVKENKFKAPRGLYLGPYASYHDYSNTRSLEVTNTDGVLEYADLTTRLRIFNVGFQLGYQFLFNNRWALDLIFIGPSISNYAVKSKVEGSYTFDSDVVNSKVMQILLDRFPAFNQLINEDEFTTRGKRSMWGYGYRYQLHLGYHFGRKKK